MEGEEEDQEDGEEREESQFISSPLKEFKVNETRN